MHRTIALLAVVALAGCSAGAHHGGTPDGGTADAGPFQLAFSTRYEPGEASGAPADANTVLTLTNLVTSPPKSLPVPATVQIGIQYEGGATTDRYARLVDDPTSPGNEVLAYWLHDAYIQTGYQGHLKGRIQTNLQFAPPIELTRLYSKQRVYLHPDLALLNGYPSTADPWWIAFTIQEFWIGSPWRNDPEKARITVAVAPDGTALRFAISMDKQPPNSSTWQRVWTSVNQDYVVPTGKCFTLETGYLEGDHSTGRFVVTCQADGDAKATVVADVHDWTYNPDAAAPVPLTMWNAQKLYTSDNVLNYITSQGGVAQAYWDDFEMGPTWPDGWPN